MQEALNPAAGWPAPIRKATEESTSLPAIGTPYQGGFFAGLIAVSGQRYALIVAPKATGEHGPAIWIPDYQDVPGAKCYDAGYANTQAMADAGSELAKWARGLDIGGHADWYLPSQDELELCYRNLKPTTRENYCYARSGINLSAVPPSRPYTPEFPVQTSAAEFQKGGAEAFAEEWYWSSTQHASASGYAWGQTFDDGLQDDDFTSNELRARAVRRSPL